MPNLKTSLGLDTAYVCLFTCAGSQAFLRAFSRFSSRRLMPRLMLFNNVSTFQSTASSLEKLANNPAVTAHLSRQRIEWRFIPARAPWFSRFWEGLTGLPKTCLGKVLGKVLVIWDILHTLLVEVKALLD